MWTLSLINAHGNWPPPNYIDPVRRGPELYILSSIFLAVATVCVAVRLWSRLFVRQWFGPDDYLVILGYASSIIVTVLVDIAFERYGWDRHTWDLFPSQWIPSARLLYFSRIAWGVASTTTRLSVLCLYYRLIRSVRAPRSFLWVNHLVTGLTIFTFLFYLFWNIFVCTPISAYWSFPPRPNDHCLDDGAALRAIAVINTFQEFMTATMPVLAVFILRVKKEQRWAVLGVLSLGYSIVVAGICRIIYINKVVNSDDPTWWASPHWICSEVENYLALVCACAPPMNPVLRRLYKNIRGLPWVSMRLSKPHRAWFGAFKSEFSTSTTSATKTLDEIGSASDWVATASRTIDLEGIAVDSFGYRVHVCGPSKAEQRRIAREHRNSKLDNHGVFRSDAQTSEKSVLGHRTSIETKTEVTVEARWEKAHSSAAPWGFSPIPEMTKVVHDSKSPSPTIGNSSKRLGPGYNLDQSMSDGTGDDDNDSDDSIYALPIMSNSEMQEPSGGPSSNHFAERLRSRWSTE